MSGVPGVTCAECLGRIDEAAFDWKRRLSLKHGRPYTPPKLCSDCATIAMLALMEDEPAIEEACPEEVAAAYAAADTQQISAGVEERTKRDGE